MIKPKALQPGATIGLIAPSGPISGGSGSLAQAEYRLRVMGYTVRRGAGCDARYGYLAGGDDVRARDVNAMFADDTVDAILCVRGGYGAMRILDKLDYDLIRAHPKIFCGFSDITALHAAFTARCGFVTFLGAMASSDMGRCDYDYDTHQSFMDAVMNTDAPRAVQSPKGYAPVALTGGRAVGPLMGGNLSLLAALQGTPYMPDTRGALLLIEDVGEVPYRIDRMMTQLKLSGVLDGCAGIILGNFTSCDPPRSASSLSLQEALRDTLPLGEKPILADLRFGHCVPRMTLPLGAMCELNVDAGTLTLLESAVCPT